MGSAVPPDGCERSNVCSLSIEDSEVTYDRGDFNWLDADQSVTYTITFQAQSGDDTPHKRRR